MPIVWLIDDDKELACDLVNFWKQCLAVSAASFRVLPVAQAALDRFHDLESRRNSLPFVVFVDGNLARDVGVFRSGTEVVRTLRSMPNSSTILIVALERVMHLCRLGVWHEKVTRAM